MRQSTINRTGPLGTEGTEVPPVPHPEGTGPTGTGGTGPSVGSPTAPARRGWLRRRSPVPKGPVPVPGAIDPDTAALLAAVRAQPGIARTRLSAFTPPPRFPLGPRDVVREITTPDPPVPADPPAPETQPDPWWLRVGLTVAVWALTAVTTSVAASGQIAWARKEIGDPTDPRAYGAPAGLELLFIALLLLGVRSARSSGSYVLYWALAAGVGGFAVYTNTQHTGASYFAPFTAATMILWFVKLREELRRHQRDKKRRTSGRPAFGLLWVFERGLTYRAWRIALRRQISTIEEAMRLAEIYRQVETRMAALSTPTVGRKGSATRPRYTAGEVAATAWAAVCAAAGDPPVELPEHIETRTIDVRDRAVPPPATPPVEDPADAVPDRVPAAWVNETPRPPTRRTPPARPVSAPPADDGHASDADLAIKYADRIQAVRDALAARGEDWRTTPRLSGGVVVDLGIPGLRKKELANTVARIMAYQRTLTPAT